MEPEAKYTLVGSAVILLAALIAGTVIWLRSSGEGADAHRYKIYFERQSLEGLELRSYVTMRGIRVGSVTGFRFSSSKPNAVELFISVDPATPVRESTRATVQRHLVTGLSTVRLENLTEDSPPLAKAPPGEPHPVIAEGESRIQQVSDNLAHLVQTADTTMQRLNETLSPQNRAALAETLQSLSRLSQRAEASLAKADATLGSLGTAADEVRAMARSISADAGKLAARYDGLGEEATVSVREINAAVRKLGADMERLARRADALLATGDDDLRTTAQSLRSAADAVGAAASRLRDPRGAIFGPPEGGLGPGEGR